MPERHWVDNSAVLRRMQQRGQRNGQSVIGRIPNTMGDYPAELPNRVLVTQGIGEKGPISSPAVSPASNDDLLQQIRDLIMRLPSAISLEWRTRFIKQPRETVSFINPSGPVAVAPGAAVAVATQKVDQMFTGFLTHVGIGAPAGSLANIIWQIRINDAIDPKFGTNGNAVFAASNLSTPIPFALELIQNTKVSIVAINTGGAPVDVSAVLVGWVEFLSTNKQYGTSPSGPVG